MASMNNILAVDALNPGGVAIQIAASVKSRRAKLDLMQNVSAVRERSKFAILRLWQAEEVLLGEQITLR